MRGCGLKLDMQHVLSCKQGGFTTIRHNNVLDSAGSLLPIICKDVDIERKLLHITGQCYIQNEKEKKRKTIEPYKLSTVALLHSYSRYMAG